MVSPRRRQEASLLSRVRRALEKHGDHESCVPDVQPDHIDELQARLLRLKRDHPAIAARVTLSEHLVNVPACVDGSARHVGTTVRG